MDLSPTPPAAQPPVQSPPAPRGSPPQAARPQANPPGTNAPANTGKKRKSKGFGEESRALKQATINAFFRR